MMDEGMQSEVSQPTTVDVLTQTLLFILLTFCYAFLSFITSLKIASSFK